MENCWRDLVVGVEESVPLADGRRVKAIQFDNAATTPPFKAVMEEISRFAPWYASVRRGGGYRSDISTNLYERGRDVIASFVGADLERDVVIYTKNTTEAVNMFAGVLAEQCGGMVVLATEMEHFANDLPWRDAFQVDYVKVTAGGELDLDDYQKKLKRYRGRIRLVTMTGASNVTGFCNDIYAMAELAHCFGAEILVDGAQLVPHKNFSMRPHDDARHIDYVVFSAHKMYAPFGSGALVGRRRAFKHARPFLKGGGTVNLAGHTFVDWETPPHKNEGGTPNLMGVLALLTAADTLGSQNMARIHAYETKLADYLKRRLLKMKDVTVYGRPDYKGDRVSIVAMNVAGIHHRILSRILSAEYGIAVRSGLFCAHPYAIKLLKIREEELRAFAEDSQKPIPGMVRVSLGVYNTQAEVDAFLRAVETIVCRKQDFLKEYRLTPEEFLLP